MNEYEKRMFWTEGFHRVRAEYNNMLMMLMPMGLPNVAKEAQLRTINSNKVTIAKMGEIYRELKLEKYYE